MPPSFDLRDDGWFSRRILQKEGAFICVSLAPPEERLELLEYWDLDSPNECLAWDAHVHAIGKYNLQAAPGLTCRGIC